MPPPLTIELKKSARVLHIVFADGVEASIGFDTLRDHSPAADGAPPAPSAGVTIVKLEQVGNYAIKPTFSDGHASGIYSWDFLYHLATWHG